MKDVTAFHKMLKELDIELKNKEIEQFLLYYDMLIEWNKVMNLTTITDFYEVINKHFIDSLTLTKVYSMNKEVKIIDMGTGAGFPGIPLKIAFPEMKVTLLDSLNKRVNFLNEVIAALGLKGIEAIHGRAEEYGRQAGYRENFDLCVSRAVAKLSTLSEYCLPYVKVDGHFIPYKAGNIREELQESKQAIHILGGTIEKTESFTLPETEIERTLIVIKKTKNTPKAYPRSAGKPTKEPL